MLLFSGSLRKEEQTNRASTDASVAAVDCTLFQQHILPPSASCLLRLEYTCKQTADARQRADHVQQRSEQLAAALAAPLAYQSSRSAIAVARCRSSSAVSTISCAAARACCCLTVSIVRCKKSSTFSCFLVCLNESGHASLGVFCRTRRSGSSALRPCGQRRAARQRHPARAVRCESGSGPSSPCAWTHWGKNTHRENTERTADKSARVQLLAAAALLSCVLCVSDRSSSCSCCRMWRMTPRAAAA